MEDKNKVQELDRKTEQEQPEKGIAPRKKFWNSDKLLSLLAILVSVGTFSTFAYQTYLIQKQQYASMMPYLTIAGYRDGSGQYYQYSLRAVNNGVGPAFIQGITLHYQDSTYQMDPGEFYFDYMSSLNLPDTIDYSVNNGYVNKGFVISAGTSMTLLESLNKTSASAIGELFWKEDGAVIEITYSSIYDELWRVTNSDPVPEKLN